MHLRRFRLLCALALFGFAQPAFAVNLQNSSLGEMEEIFFLSGLEAQLEGFASGLDESLAQQASVFGPGQLSVLRTAVARSFAPEVLRSSIRTGLESHYDARGATGTLAWLRSPLGRRINRLEEENSTSDSMAQLEAFADGLAASPPTAMRLAQIDELNRASGVADVSVDLALTAALGIALGGNASQPVDQRADEALLEAAVEAQREALAGQMQTLLQLNSLKTYQSLSDEELSTYIEFVTSAPGQWYHEAVVAELVAALKTAAAGVGAMVAHEMNATGDSAANLAD